MITHRKFRAGETVHRMVIAQDKMHEITDGNIVVWYFTYPDRVLIFWMHAERKGSGRLLSMLRELERRTGKPVHVADPIFARMISFLERHKIPYCSPYPEIAMRRPRKPHVNDLKPYCGVALPPQCEEWVEAYTQLMMGAPDTPDGLRYEMRFGPKEKAAYMKAAPYLEGNARPPNSAMNFYGEAAQCA